MRKRLWFTMVPPWMFIVAPDEVPEPTVMLPLVVAPPYSVLRLPAEIVKVAPIAVPCPIVLELPTLSVPPLCVKVVLVPLVPTTTLPLGATTVGNPFAAFLYLVL